jgi:AcrR family transcriptional regulator
MTEQSRVLQSRVRPTRSASGTQARGDRTRANIIEETAQCVLEEGFAAASALHIAERAGVTWGVIQYHFGDRNGLLAAVIESGFEGLRDELASVDIPGGTIRERLTILVDAAWVAFSTPTSRASLEILVATRAGRDAVFTDLLTDMAHELARLGAVVVNDPIGKRHSAAVGDFLWATLRGLVLAQMVVQDPLDTSRERAILIEVLANYLEGLTEKAAH